MSRGNIYSVLTFLCFRFSDTNANSIFCKFEPGVIGKYGYKMRNDDYLLYLHRAMELYPLYSQCFLTFGMSFERWVCVCRPHNAKQILNKQNRLWLTFVAIALSVGVPSAFLPTWFITRIQAALY